MARISMVHFLTKERTLPNIQGLTSEMPELEDETERRYTDGAKSTGLMTRGLQEALVQIKELADQHPYYKYNGMWTRQMENLSFCIVLMGWLGMCVGNEKDPCEEGTLFTYEQVAKTLGRFKPDETWLIAVPTDEDDSKFHLSIEEYLHSLISLINELVGLFLSNSG